jgi:hypothetical protein
LVFSPNAKILLSSNIEQQSGKMCLILTMERVGGAQLACFSFTCSLPETFGRIEVMEPVRISSSKPIRPVMPKPLAEFKLCGRLFYFWAALSMAGGCLWRINTEDRLVAHALQE